jgi:hypothetical protein
MAGQFPLPVTAGPSVLVRVGNYPTMRYAVVENITYGKQSNVG